MGSPMGHRLLEAGYTLSVWNRTPEKYESLIRSGACPADSLQQVSLNAEVIFLCLTDTLAVEEVWQTMEASIQSGTIIIDCSSIDPLATQKLAQLAEIRGCHWLDCPVSGGVQGAKSGSLAMMVGGDPDVLDKVKPLLAPLSSQVTYMGPSGSGQYAKICNQMIVSCNALVIAEVVAFAERSGVDSSKLAAAFAGGFADSKPLQILAPEMASRSFTPPKWHVNTLLKDLGMAVDHSALSDADTPMTRLAHQLMAEHSEQGYGHEDPSTLVLRYTSEEGINNE